MVVRVTYPIEWQIYKPSAEAIISVGYRLCLSIETHRLSNKCGNNHTYITPPVGRVGSWSDPVSHGVRQKGNVKYRMPSEVNTGIVKWWRYHALSKRSWYLWHHDMETNPALLALCDRWLPIIKDHKCGALLFELVFVWTRRRLNKQSMCLWFEQSWVVTVICMRISFQTPMYRASHQKD